MKTCLVRQPAGLGDILYCSKIVKLLLDTGRCDEIIWPVISQYNFLGNYLTDSRIYYPDENGKFPHKQYYTSDIINITETDDLIYIPLQHADRSLPYNAATHNHPMYVKYEMCNNLEFNDWCDYVNINRNERQEKNLANELNIDISNPFNIVNVNFGSPPNSVKGPQPEIQNDFPIIQMEYIPNYNIFDWMLLLESATEIHTVETSLCYLLKYLKLTNISIYPKSATSVQNHSFKYVEKIYDSEWNYVT